MEVRRTTVRDMRRSNRSVILTSIYRDGPLSRQELTGRTSLSAASVSNLVAELIAEGVVEEGADAGRHLGGADDRDVRRRRRAGPRGPAPG